MAIASKYIPAPDCISVRRALVSVSDKTGLMTLVQSLADRQIEIVSTGGTCKAIRDAGIAVTDITDVTGFPEIMDGRVKTLHPKVHGGLLAVRDDPDHVAALDHHGIKGFDLVVVNLYPFENVVANGADTQTTIENIDIGGPAMVRASAKNHNYVTILTSPDDYSEFLSALDHNDGKTTLAFRQALAAKAFQRTASYDAMIANWMTAKFALDGLAQNDALGGTKAADMRYGENPHQNAALYLTGEKRPGAATATIIQGKALSYNNINDTDAAFELVAEFDPTIPSVAIIKHANPCGVASASSLADAYQKAYDCDRTSAFGGIVALNQTLDAATAEKITEIFTEVIIAPDVDEDARAIISKKKNLRLLITGGLPDISAQGYLIRPVAGGYLKQSRDTASVDAMTLTCVTERQPKPRELDDMRFAFRVAKHVKSNAIVYVRDGATVGIGAGQMSRVDASRIAARKAQDAATILNLNSPQTIGSVVASDAFFPFADGLEAAIDAGATAVIQPGGSMRDNEVIEAANRAGLCMIMTGHRHFRH